jgi:hypothetical protein
MRIILAQGRTHWRKILKMVQPAFRQIVERLEFSARGTSATHVLLVNANVRKFLS